MYNPFSQVKYRRFAKTLHLNETQQALNPQWGRKVLTKDKDPPKRRHVFPSQTVDLLIYVVRCTVTLARVESVTASSKEKTLRSQQSDD